MPLLQRLIEPVHVSRGALPLDAKGAPAMQLPSELECVTNGTLANVVRQLSSLSKHADDLFGALFRDATALVARAGALQARVDRLTVKVTQLDSTVEEVSLQDIHMRKAFRSSIVYDQQVVSRATMPAGMLEMYQACDKPPPLDKLNPYRDDGKDGLKFYTDPNYFFDLWRQEMLKDTERIMLDRGKKVFFPLCSPTGQKAKESRRCGSPTIRGSASASWPTHGSFWTRHPPMAPAPMGGGAPRPRLLPLRLHPLSPSPASPTDPCVPAASNFRPARSRVPTTRPRPPAYSRNAQPPPQTPTTIPPPPPEATSVAAMDATDATSVKLDRPLAADGAGDGLDLPPPPPAPDTVAQEAAAVVASVAPPPPPPPLPPANGSESSGSSKGGVKKESPPPAAGKGAKETAAPTDARSDLLAAIREGIKLRRVEDFKQKQVEKAAQPHDVASILARRVAIEVSDSESGSDSEYDSDWDNETEC
ncbi:conserved hypothetical protein [Ixodes scapularis]|uniref:Wiskott-Aldrich syndrome protein family member n=1 Tax=Ixodes scapularis TaxID=6945 RepID=B7PSM1_IXOSC|nr:conserved hypothetical protein [Ixodes scapularis]|eukprot:XP_002402727.1 conserved hypothetical protein [Ixodes scapularis]